MTVSLFQALAENNKIKENPVLREIVLLGYGTMISKHCAELTVCPSELIKVLLPFFRVTSNSLAHFCVSKGYLISHFHQQPIQDLLAEAVIKGVTQDIILYLKVLGNAGHPTSVKPITKILPIHGTAAASLPMRVHADAIMALRNIAKKEPRMVNSQHWGIFKAILVLKYNVRPKFALSSLH